MNVHDIRSKQDTTLVAGLRAAGDRVEPPTSLDPTAMAQRAVRTVRRRRVALVVAGGVAAAVVATAGGLVLTYGVAADRSVLPGSSDASAAPSPVASTEPTPEATVPRPAAVPSGWQAAEFRGLSYAVPGGWTSVPLDEATVDWSGPGHEVEIEGDETMGGTGSVADSLSLRIDLRKPPGVDRAGEDQREELVVAGAESALLTAGKNPESPEIEWMDLVLHHEDGLWYTAHVEFVTDEARPGQVISGLAESLAFTSSAQEVRDTLPDADDLPVVEVDGDTPSDWVVHELDGLRYAVPAGMSTDPTWAENGIEGAEGWLVPHGVQEGVDLSVTTIREYDGYNGTSAPPEDASTFTVDGAARVQVTMRVSEPWHNGATPLDVQLSVWDEEMAGAWLIAATLPNTPEGERIALRILGSVRVL